MARLPLSRVRDWLVNASCLSSVVTNSMYVGPPSPPVALLSSCGGVGCLLVSIWTRVYKVHMQVHYLQLVMLFGSLFYRSEACGADPQVEGTTPTGESDGHTVPAMHDTTSDQHSGSAALSSSCLVLTNRSAS